MSEGPRCLGSLKPSEPRRSATGAFEFAALLFLTLPLVIFFVGFTARPLAILAVLVIMVSLWRSLPSLALPPKLAWPQIALCAVLSAVFLWACAYLPPFGRSWDWLKHFALINELARYPWPPVNEETHTFLRYGLGYHMLPGLLAGLLSERLINAIVFLETWTGLFLVLALLLQKIRPSRPTIFLAIFLLFGGLDLVGWMLFRVDHSIWSTKEWWTGSSFLFAYEGHASLFLWVPQHALSGMLGTLLLLPDVGRPVCPRALGLIGAAVLFWSPFAAFGLLPFALVIAARDWRMVATNPLNYLCVLVLGVPLVAYLLAGTDDIPRGVNWITPGFSWTMYSVFVLLEVGLYLIWLWFYGWRHLRYPLLVVPILLILPLYRVGLYNDFTMRAGIPAIMLIAMAVAATVSDGSDYKWVPLAVLVAVGCAGSLVEIIGRGHDGYVSVRDQSLRRGFLFEDPRLFVQYNAPLPSWVLRR